MKKQIKGTQTKNSSLNNNSKKHLFFWSIPEQTYWTPKIGITKNILRESVAI